VLREDALPSKLRLEGFTVPNLDSPGREWNANIVETGGSDSGEILLSRKTVVLEGGRGARMGKNELTVKVL
jgi:hypothetical protein